MQWIYRLEGSFPAYEPPSAFDVTSRVDSHISERVDERCVVVVAVEERCVVAVAVEAIRAVLVVLVVVVVVAVVVIVLVVVVVFIVGFVEVVIVVGFVVEVVVVVVVVVVGLVLLLVAVVVVWAAAAACLNVSTRGVLVHVCTFTPLHLLPSWLSLSLALSLPSLVPASHSLFSPVSI